MNPLYMLLAIPAFFVLIGIELLVGAIQKKNLYRFNDAVTNLNIGVGSRVYNAFFKTIIFGSYIWIFDHWALFQQPQSWWSFMLVLVLYDFLYYWAHRWGHTVNFFWGAHLVHHQSEEYNLSVALRQSWFHNMLAFFIFLPLPFLGFDPLIFGGAAVLNSLYQFWIHTKTVGKLHPWIEFILNTPSHHRVHHGVDPKYVDRNHGGMFIIWDRLFGTFQEEEEEPTYGLVKPLKSWNAVWANFHYYVELFELAKRMDNWRDRLKLLFAKPGWRPSALGGMQEVPEVDKTQRKKYDTRTSWLMKAYVAVQFLLIAAGLLAFMYFYSDLTWFWRTAFALLLTLALLVVGGIFENKRWVVIAEYAKLALLLFSLNAFYYLWYLDWFWVMLVASSVVFILLNVFFTVSWVWSRKELAAII